jgi:NADPH:quinone reductase-like Zn-dependent oxidoreductase
VLRLTEIAKPIPGDKDILIRVCATTVTAGDWRMRRADPFLARIFNGLLSPKKVNVLGFEVSGEVVAIGKDVRRFKPGDSVFASCGFGFGGYAEYKVLPEDEVIAIKPDHLSHEEAAAVPIGALTALTFLRQAKIQPGQQVLIYGASGSVGTYAVQVAKHFGAEVTGVCSTSNLHLVESLGADRLIDYTREDFSRSGLRYDVVFDAVGKASYAACVQALKPDGFFLSANLGVLDMLRGKWTAMTSRKRVTGGTAAPQPEDLYYLKTLLEAGQLKPVIDRCYELAQIQDAHRYVEQHHKKGNVAITVAAPLSQ